MLASTIANGTRTWAQWLADGYNANGLNEDPQFWEIGVNFALRESSPAIDAGVTLAEVGLDIHGFPRPQGILYDLGAYETLLFLDTGMTDLLDPNFPVASSGLMSASMRQQLGVLRESQLVSLARFGAVGDGVADNSAKLAEALTSVMGSGKTLFVPKGTYLCSSWTPLVQSGPVRVKMEAGAVIKIGGTAAFFAAGPAVLYEFNVEDGEIDMDQGGIIADWRGHSAGETVMPLLRLFGVTIRNKVDATAPAEVSAKDFVLWDTSFDRVLVDRVEIHYCHFIGGTIGVELSGVKNGSVTNNVFEQMTYLGVSINRGTNGLGTIHEPRSGRMLFSGNRFFNIINTAASTDTHGLMLFGAGFMVLGNFFGLLRSSNGNSNAEGFYAKAIDLIVSKNVFEDAGGQRGFCVFKGIPFLDPSPFQQHPEGYAIICTGNTFRMTAAFLANSTAPTGGAPNAVAVHLEVTEVLLADNYFYNIQKFQVVSCDSALQPVGGVIKIDRNHFLDCGTGADTRVLNLPSISGVGMRLVVSNNVFTQHQSTYGRVIYFENNADTKIIIENNWLENAANPIWVRRTSGNHANTVIARNNSFLNCTNGFRVDGAATIALMIRGNNRQLGTGAIQESISGVTITNSVVE